MASRAAELGAPDRIIAGPKHFAGYGAALGGRDYDEVNLSDSELWNVYFPPFKAAVEAGAGNVMTAYMDLNGIPAAGNRWLFTEVLRETWGFEGFVVSDANAVRNLVTHGFAADLTDAGARAVNAGVDMEMAITDPAYGHLPEALESGAASPQAVDASVRRVLEAKIRMGLFDAPYVDEDRAREVLADPAHRDVARIAAERSAVLLRNEGDLLPLDAGSLSSIAVIGPLADSKRDTIGPWVFDFDLDETVTVLEGIRAKAGEGVRVDHARGVRVVQRVFPSLFDMFGGNKPADPEGFDEEAEFQQAVDLARGADVAVVVAGEWQNMIGEAASRSSLELPGRQLELLQAVVETGTPVVLLVMNGRPLDLRWPAEHVPAILDIWYPGTRGGAAVGEPAVRRCLARRQAAVHLAAHRRAGADGVLTHPLARAREPGAALLGRGQHAAVPVRVRPELRPFRVRQPHRRSACRHHGGTVTVSVEVTNTADREADEVVQLYIHQRHGSASRPVRELKGFQRVTLAAGESRTLQFPVGPNERRYWNAAVRDWVTDSSTFDVWVGGDSTAPAVDDVRGHRGVARPAPEHCTVPASRRSGRRRN